MAVIAQVVQTEIAPLAGWQQGIDLDAVVLTRAQATETGDDEVVEGEVLRSYYFLFHP